MALRAHLEELVALGALAIGALEGELSDALVDERLIEFFSAFERSGAFFSGDYVEVTEADKELLRRVISQHHEIEKLVENQMRSIDQRLKESKAWIKGVRVYLDSYPKSVSTIKSRRG